MTVIDKAATQVLERLQNAFPKVPIYNYWGSRVSVPPIDIEIEVPWSGHHPTLWKEYFKEGSLRYEEMQLTRREALDHACALEEVTLFPLIKKAKDCMKVFEGMHYWEFCFPPAHDTGIHLGICRILEQVGLCPFNGPHPMQVTVGGLVPSKETYQMLMYLELRYSSKERLLHGLGNKGWALKGNSGIFHKEKIDLQFGYKTGIEIRPLVLPASLEDMVDVLSDCALLASEIYLMQHGGNKTNKMEAFSLKMSSLVKNHNLPDRLWPNPGEDPRPLYGFIERYESMKRQLPTLRQLGFG